MVEENSSKSPEANPPNLASLFAMSLAPGATPWASQNTGPPPANSAPLPTDDDDEDEWEYEYSTTETEVRQNHPGVL